MNLFADEGIDRQIVERLRQDGHSVIYIAELAPGISDDVILTQATSQGALLLTADKDFGELVYRQRLVHSGVVLIRLANLRPDLRANTVAAVFQEHSAELLGAFSVVSPGTLRIRRPT